MSQNEMLEEIRVAIGERVRDIGADLGHANPKTIGVVLAGAALWPFVVPLLGGGAVVTVAGAALSLLEEPGRKFVTDFVRRLGDRGLGPPEAQTSFQAALAQRLAADDGDASALRADVGRLLREAGGVGTALDAAPAELKDALAQGLAELSSEWREFRWMLGEVQLSLQDIQRRQSEGLAMQRATLDLQREQLVKTTLLLQRQDLPAAATPIQPAEDGAVAPEPPAEGVCPYKGLLAFQPEDAEFFFGREALLADVIARLSEARFVAVVGASGSGKSSFVRAGLLAAIWKGALPGSPDVRVLVMTPGDHPLEQLALRIGVACGVSGASILNDLRADPTRLVVAARQLLLDAPSDARLMLLVDQFEELFTLCRDADERRAFVEALLATLSDEDCPVNLVIAVRADFYGRFTAFPALALAVQDHQALVGRMSPDDLRRAIELPAAAAGLTLEPGLVDAMLDDLGDEPGALPLLSHALLETWRRRRGSTLTLAGYHEAGGVAGAIAQTAQTVVGELDAREQALARRVFLGLTEVGEGAEPTRRRVKSDDLVASGVTPELVKVLDLLAEARLVTLDEAGVEVAHEALIRHWPTLRRWLDEAGESLRVQRRLVQAADEWEQLGRDPGALYRGARLTAAVEWAQDHPEELGDRTRAFLEAGRAAEAAELAVARRRTRNLKLVAAGLGLLAVVAAVSAIVAIGKTGEARSQQRLALSRGLTSVSTSVLAQDPGRAALLGLEAYRLHPDEEARDAVLSALPHLGRANGVLAGRAGGPQRLAFSPDGRLLATASSDGVQLWDVATRAAVGEPLRAKGEGAMAFSPDGRWLATGDDGVQVWDIRRRKPLARQVRGEGFISDLAFSPDGKRLAVAGGSGRQAIVWDLATGRRQGSPLVQGDGALSITFSSDGRTIVTAGGDEQIRFWDSETQAPARKPIRGGRYLRAALSPDGTMFATTGDSRVRVRRLSDGRRLGPALGAEHASSMGTGVARFQPSNARFSADGELVGFVDGDGAIRLWSVSDRRYVGAPLGTARVRGWSVAFSADGKTVATADDQAVRLWNLAPPAPLSRVLPAKLVADAYGGHAIRRVAFAPGRRVLAAASDDNTLRLWSTSRSGSPGATLHGPPLTTVLPGETYGFVDAQFSPDGRTLGAASWDGTARLWRVAANPPRATPVGGLGGLAAYSLAFSADGSQLAVADDTAIRLRALSPRPAKKREPARFAMLDQVVRNRIAFVGSSLLAATNRGRVDLYAVASGRPAGVLARHSSDITDLAASPDGSLAATSGHDKAATIWDVATRKPARPRLMHPQAVNAIGLGRTVVATGGEDGAARIWSLQSGRLVGAPLDAGAPVTSVALDPDSGALATGDRDGRVRLWNPLLWTDDVAALRRRVCAATRRNLSRAEWSQLLPGEPYRKTCPAA